MEQIHPSDRISTSQTEYTQQSPLGKLSPTPSAIPELWGKLNENLSNAWNEFVSEYDPVESPRALKTLPGAFHVAGLVLIATVSALRELSKKSNGRDTSSEAPVTAVMLLAAIQKECNRRNLTIPKVFLFPWQIVSERIPKSMNAYHLQTTCTIFKKLFLFTDYFITTYNSRPSKMARYGIWRGMDYIPSVHQTAFPNLQ